MTVLIETPPQTLNGHRVVAFKPRFVGSPEYCVMVFTDDRATPYVVADWNPMLKDEWLWGNYFETASEAFKWFNSKWAE